MSVFPIVSIALRSHTELLLCVFKVSVDLTDVLLPRSVYTVYMFVLQMTLQLLELSGRRL